MRLDVAVVPSEAASWDDMVIIMVDVIRTSTTVVTLLDRGCRHVYPVSDSRHALDLAAQCGFVTIGERDGEILPGFDFNNSPRQLLSSAHIRSRDVILSTTNGTMVLQKIVPGSKNTVLIGAAVNATACARSAVAMCLAGGRDMGLLCAGRNGRLATDDVVCAGLLVEKLTACAQGTVIEYSDGAKAAAQLYHAYSSLLDAFTVSESGSILKRLGEEADIELCARTDVSRTVPVVAACPEAAGLRLSSHG